MNNGIYEKTIKRSLDITVSLIGLVVCSPVLLATSFLVRKKLGRPVVFKQVRPGMNEKFFNIYKFRSMTNETGEDGKLLPDAQRLTPFGKFLRTSSLDELLELFNILKGDMSIVGPRPLSIYYLCHYPEGPRKRQEVRPGLTGLAQVNGRNNLQWPERFALDIKYVDNVTFLEDVKIILKTVTKVLKKADISVRGTTKVLDYGPYCILQEEKDGGKKVPGMTYSEIGSYFWLDGQEQSVKKGNVGWLPNTDDSCFTFSGRAAIYTALNDILQKKKIKKIYVPSYSCVSMLQSFLDKGFKPEFYEVQYKDGAFHYQLPDADESSIVLIMSYFGLNTDASHEVIKTLHDKGATIIEDITHSMLSNYSSSEFSDYYVASLRKWFAIPTGGWIGKRRGSLSAKPDIDSDDAVQDKISGMCMKYDYLKGEIKDKEEFLLIQAKFDNDLIHVDRMLRIDSMSLGIVSGIKVDAVIDRRRRNAEVLLTGLQDLDGRGISLPDVDLSVDTPLFMPIFLEREERNSLRNYLIGRGIYCPVHWPEIMGAPVGVRDNELSLICDQRYSDGDMTAIVDAIHEWYKEKQK